MTENLPVKATSIDGVSRMYGLGKDTVKRAIRSGALRVSRVGRRVVIRISEAEKWIDASRSGKSARRR